MASARHFLLVALAALATATVDARAQGSPPISNFFEGWDSFMQRRASHPFMRKMGPYLAAEWWQRVERQPLWPGRAIGYETGILVDEDGLIGLTIVLDDPGAWAHVAHLLGPKGRASMPSEGAVRAGPIVARTPTGDPVAPLASGSIASGPRQRYEGYENTLVQIATDPAPIPSATLARDRMMPTPEPTSTNLRSTWTVYVRAPLASVAAFARSPHVVGIFESIRGPGLRFDQGASTTEGLQTHLTHSAQQSFPAARGRNTGVVILSDGIQNLEDLKKTNDLPGIVELAMCQGGRSLGKGKEGGALAEVIHDIAPDARLSFLSVFLNVPTQFEDDVRFPRHVADVIRCAGNVKGVTVIVDDLAQTPFETALEPGPIQRAIREVTQKGIIYVTSAGNEGNQFRGGNRRVWVQIFSPLQRVRDIGDPFENPPAFALGPGETIAIPGGFGPGDLWRVEETGDSIGVTIGQRADQFNTNYVLAIANSRNVPPRRPLSEGSEQDVSIRMEPPGQCFGFSDEIFNDCLNFRYQGSALQGQLFTVFKRLPFPGQSESNNLPLYVEVTRRVDAMGRTTGILNPSTQREIARWKGFEDVITVGAIGVAPACTGTPPSCVPFSGSDRANAVSSDGPSIRVNPMLTVLQKPDLSAADGVQTQTFPSGFFGSSASAAEVAGEVAVLVSAFQSAKCRVPTMQELDDVIFDTAKGTATPERGLVPDVRAAVQSIYMGMTNDADSDSVNDSCDVCLGLKNPDQLDGDLDGLGDPCDNCPNAANPRVNGVQPNVCGSSLGSAGPDRDMDGIGDAVEPLYGTDPGRADTDMDGIADGIELKGPDGVIGTTDDENPLRDDSDSDRDEAPAYYDNCPLAANRDQADNGTLSGATLDAIGDLCQCGETSGDGAIFQQDTELVRQRLVGLPSAGLGAPQRCNVFGPAATTIGAGGLPTDCDLLDVIVTKRALAGLGPGIAQTCAPALGL